MLNRKARSRSEFDGLRYTPTRTSFDMGRVPSFDRGSVGGGESRRKSVKSEVTFNQKVPKPTFEVVSLTVKVEDE